MKNNLFKRTFIAASLLLLSASAYAKETAHCGTISASTGGFVGGQQTVWLKTNSGIFQVVSGPTETTDVQEKLESLMVSLQPEQICVKTIFMVIDNTILASGFIPVSSEGIVNKCTPMTLGFACSSSESAHIGTCEWPEGFFLPVCSAGN